LKSLFNRVPMFPSTRRVIVWYKLPTRLVKIQNECIISSIWVYDLWLYNNLYLRERVIELTAQCIIIEKYNGITHRFILSIHRQRTDIHDFLDFTIFVKMYEYNLTITFIKFNTNWILNIIIIALINKRSELNNLYEILWGKKI